MRRRQIYAAQTAAKEAAKKIPFIGSTDYSNSSLSYTTVNEQPKTRPVIKRKPRVPRTPK